MNSPSPALSREHQLRSADARGIVNSIEHQMVLRKLRGARQRLGLTLKDVSDRVLKNSAGRMSPAHLSRIENGVTVPSYVEMLWLNDALENPLGPAFGASRSEPWFVVRASQVAQALRDVIESPDPAERQDRAHREMLNLRIFNYVPLDRTLARAGEQSLEPMNPMMQAHIFSVGHTSAEMLEQNLDSHEGEEFIYVISGDLEFWYQQDNETPTQVSLGPGDSLHYSSKAKHAFRATGAEPARALFVYTAPPEIKQRQTPSIFKPDGNKRGRKS